MSETVYLPLQEARRRFFDGQTLPADAVPPAILQSWQRCLGLGMPAAGRRQAERLGEQTLRERREYNGDWLALARPTLDGLFEGVVDDGHVVIVADARGLILDASGNAAFLDRAEQVALTPGMDWSEEVRGTNAIGTALALGGSVRVRGGEHYLERNRSLSCTARTLVDPLGQTLGVIDVSGLPRRLGDGHGQLVEATVRLIEQQLFGQRFGRHDTLLVHPDPTQLGTPRAGRLAFDEAERLVAANRQALGWLGLDWSALQQHRFADLFGESLGHWRARYGVGTILLPHGGRLPLSARLLPAASATPAARPRSVADREAVAKAPATAAVLPVQPQCEAGLPDELSTRALRLFEADIPVLLQGETGVGKDRFARWLHQASSRTRGPFVAVNCAAIPDGLIEAELFGYEEGAFTGARRQGSRGRLREAHGGVLFLDEIGDMPLALQARLLRVLQDRLVTPLGGGTSHSVDLRLICATHRPLKRLVEQEAFRADLYYRLCHYPLRLPPLRERGDVAAIAQQLLDARGARSRDISLAPALLQAMRRYAWPGNLRELDNLLATLLALADDGNTLTLDHLPEELREDMLRDEAKPLDDSLLEQALARCGGNVSAAARALGISRSTLYRQRRRAG
ncbi:sigma-54-dependent Fis family transcriptional regulator [Crenobacter sp. SG2303]|uniref:Sigma-54-dependent Fis family transcriptional regulator n=1 Tax=Crenobacter oryzisoli TaxID=3056844 RepID=A0ABT7XKJ7_9NEIS|nr:sigma-54-dependent Fis family transcriptional regulator [Crenobacter sp. SG2303]MDN0074301.1 sigma-54-dependent Fis family transcriptional regulator [Crenobacter sp. SG2303]